MSHLLPIASLALNPAIDMSYLVPQLLAGDKSQSTNARYDPGGNGINVARVLARLNREAHVCCVLAGESGDLLHRLLNREQVEPEYVMVKGETRINCTIQQRRPPAEYKVSGIGPDLQAGDLAMITERFLELADNGFGVLTGSLPPGTPPDIYAKLAMQLRRQGAHAVVDAKNNTLLETIEAQPCLIKPNRYELEVMCGKSLPTLEAIATQARAFQRAGVDFVCVSMGEEGAILVTEDDSLFARAPRIRLRCTVGAGDAMVAGLVAGIADGKPPEDVLRLGLACGSGAVTQPGTMLFDPTTLESLQKDLPVESLGI